MKLRREQTAFLGVAVLTVALTLMGGGDGRLGGRVPTARRLEPTPIALPARVAVGPAVPDAAGPARDRSTFAPPRDLLPLDPLVLPDPPLPAVSVRRPSAWPALTGSAARAYRMRPSELGSLSLQGGDAPLDPLDPSRADAPPSPAGDAGSSDAGASAAAEVDLSDAVLEDRFDWVVRLGSSRRLYGHLLNEDPHGLDLRPDEDLLFQQVSERHGGPVGAPFTLPRSEVERFGLAATFENDYRDRSRRLGDGPGATSSRRALAEELLAAWPGQPLALDFARAEAERALLSAPRDVASARLLAAILRTAHDLEGELALYRRAADEGWADSALLAGYARLVGELGLSHRAEALLEEGRRLSRASAEVALVTGRRRLDEGRPVEALAALREASRLSVEHPFTDREVALDLGEALVATADLEGAEREARRLLLDDGDDARAWMLLGAVAAARDDLDAAASSFGSALAAAPGDALVVYDAGVIAWRQRDGAGARRLLERARDADPFRAARPTLALGFLHEDAGLPEVARDLYASVLQLEPDDPEALYRLGRRQRRDGDPAGAVGTLRRALRLAGPETLLLQELARASIDRGRHEEAQRYLREAERLEPDDGEVQWALGLAALAAGDAFGALDPLGRAVDLGQPGAHNGLAVASYRRGDARAALDHLGEVAKAYAGRADDPQARWAAEVEADIRDNLSKRQWVDRFGRTSLQRGWIDHQWDGSPRVFLDGGTLRIEGRMERPRDDEQPGVSRPVEGDGFFAAQAEVVAGAAGDTRAGLSLTYRQLKGGRGRLPKARLQIRLDPDGTVRTSVLDSFDTIVRDGEPVAGVTVARDEPVLLGIERLDEVNGTFAFTLNGRAVGEPVTVKSLRAFTRNVFDLEVWAEAPPGGRVSAAIELVRIVQAP